MAILQKPLQTSRANPVGANAKLWRWVGTTYLQQVQKQRNRQQAGFVVIPAKAGTQRYAQRLTYRKPQPHPSA